MTKIQDSALFYYLLRIQQLSDISVDNIYFFILGYDTKNLSEGNNEEWVNEFIVFMDLKVSKLYYNIETRYPMSFGYIIMKHQETNKKGLDLFFKLFYEFCEVYIVNFYENLDNFKNKAIKKLSESDFI
ncbi:MAG TPA: hypothetical protein PKD32_11460 [Saprospiraceae bacterium]|nr:hypothetical protein [Saprospiraceae bacterium]